MANLWILNQFNKGNKSCITDAIVAKLNLHSCAMTKHNCIKFHKIPLNGYLVMTQLGNSRAITHVISEAIPTICTMHRCVMAIHCKYKGTVRWY